jgi:SAM-dependent methyltransferase
MEYHHAEDREMKKDMWSNPRQAWDERFTQPEPVYGEAPNRFLAAQVARFPSGARLLVPGDGYGRNGVWLAKQGFQVHTVDLSPVGVERAKKTAKAAGVKMTIECADLATWNWPENAFDGALAIFLHLPGDLRKKVHGSMMRVLKPGGLVILEAFSPGQLRHTSGGPKDVALLYSAETIREDFAGAEVIELEERESEISEGPLHSGPAAVVNAVLRRKA